LWHCPVPHIAKALGFTAAGPSQHSLVTPPQKRRTRCALRRHLAPLPPRLPHSAPEGAAWLATISRSPHTLPVGFLHRLASRSVLFVQKIGGAARSRSGPAGSVDSVPGMSSTCIRFIVKPWSTCASPMWVPCYPSLVVPELKEKKSGLGTR
jgi:hypothetical protein